MRYYGGKWRLAPWIISHFPPHRTYVEPFGGAGSVLLQKPRSYGEIINDINGDVVNLFRVLQAPASAAKLRRLCELTPFARAEFDLARKPTRDPVERARRLIVRAYMGIGSGGAQGKPTGFRFSANRAGTTPAMDWARWPAQIPRYVDRLASVVVECQPALELLEDHDGPGTLYYVDPPYPLASRREGVRRKGRYRHEMSDSEHREASVALHGVIGMVVISGYECPLYGELYGDWESDRTTATADNGCHGTRSIADVKRTEVVWLNPACSAALARARSQLSLLDAEPVAP